MKTPTRRWQSTEREDNVRHERFTVSRCIKILVRGLVSTIAHTTELSYRAVLISLLMIEIN